MNDEIADVPFEKQEVQEQEKHDNDNNFEPIEPIEQKRYCRKCKQWLPVSYFEKYGTGIRHICKACQHNIKNPSEKFIDFTSRELIEELRRRGYKGKLTYTEITEVKL